MGSSRIVALTLGGVLVAACLTGCGKYYWGKSGATQAQFDQDNRECAKEAAPSPSAAQYGIVYEGYYRACLNGRGWKREKHSEPPPAGWFRGIE